MSIKNKKRLEDIMRNIHSKLAAIVMACMVFAATLFMAKHLLAGPAAKAGYIGTALPYDFVPFSKKSPWNTPVPDKTPSDPNSALMVANLKNKAGVLKGNIVHWSVPLFVIDSGTSPKRDVRTTSERLNPLVDPSGRGVAQNIPIPESVWPDPKEDGHMLLVDPVKMKSWDFSVARMKPDGSWTASRIDIWDLKGKGYREAFSGDYWWTFGARGSGMPLIAGLIRPEEIEAGEIRHALVCSTPVNRKSSVPGAKPELCSPTASRTDGAGSGNEFIPEGARLQLEPSLNIDSLPISPATKVIASALQKYGMYVGDNASTFVIYFQNLGPDGGKWKKYDLFNDLKNIPVEKFRVVKCSLKVQGQK